MELFWQYEPAKVEFHLNGGYTKVILERLVGQGMLEGRWFWDIPTTSIPPNLRQIGSCFLLAWQSSYFVENSADILVFYSHFPVVKIAR